MLLGGPSGVGKTTLARRLAYQLRMDVTQLDDLFMSVRRLTTPASHPSLHALRTHPDVDSLAAEEIVEMFRALCAAFAPAIETVVEEHVAERSPVLLEGDYLLPETVACLRARHRSGDAIRALFLFEADEQRILANYRAREPAAGAQTMRARVSWLHGQWMKEECARSGSHSVAVAPEEDAVPASLAHFTIEGRVLRRVMG